MYILLKKTLTIRKKEENKQNEIYMFLDQFSYGNQFFCLAFPWLMFIEISVVCTYSI